MKLAGAGRISARVGGDVAAAPSFAGGCAADGEHFVREHGCMHGGGGLALPEQVAGVAGRGAVIGASNGRAELGPGSAGVRACRR